MNSHLSVGAQQRTGARTNKCMGYLTRLSAGVEWENPVRDNILATHLAIETILMLRPMQQKRGHGV